MLNPGTIADAMVTAFRTIPALVTAMAGDATRISAHHYLFGTDNRLELAVAKMASPSILVAFRLAQPGNFDGSTIFKYHYEIYVRAANSAKQIVPLSYEGLWVLMFNSPVNGTGRNIRYINLVAGADIMESPGLLPTLDEDRMDYLTVQCVVPEIGDNP